MQIAMEGWVLFVSGIHEEADEEDVYDLFREYGDVQGLHMPLDRRTGYVKGYALIEYKSPEEAQKARGALNKTEMLERTIRVTFAFKAPPNDDQKMLGRA
mmetsp:Transcript_17296/g.32829  ORF Transcript_17296/g.32829 Transcript_17296/m.32829 type:complete len:100 (-) Transcript_17296:218-517(-)